MVRRPSEADAAGEVALGLPLPPSAGKLRLAFTLPDEVVSAACPPPQLSTASQFAPASWRETLERLVAIEPDVRVFGALGWRALTGLDYLSPTSDLDLLWPTPPGEDATRLVAAILIVEAAAPMRLDGELVRPAGAAVNWRELASGADEVLVKRLDGVTLQSRRGFLEGRA